MKLSYKDLLLVAGVVVALIIGATALIYKDAPSRESKKQTPKPRTSLSAPSAFVKKLISSATL